jgi:hypothetical protein
VRREWWRSLQNSRIFRVCGFVCNWVSVFFTHPLTHSRTHALPHSRTSPQFPSP